MKLNRFKYFIREYLFAERTNLYTSLDEALVLANEFRNLELVPSGHAPWQPSGLYQSTPPRPPSPVVGLVGFPWWVLRTRTFKDGEVHQCYVGQFGCPRDAFAFAELKAAQTKKRRDDNYERFFVVLRARAENGCEVELARLAPNHLTKLYRAQERAWRRPESLAAVA
ncbi:MAG TPA: hypothetical protein VLH79_06760 [Chthonomonadales bacterium]|nr:hypothetical protein [Chthonomonadales bacterium]